MTERNNASKSNDLFEAGDHALWLNGHVVYRVGIVNARHYVEDGFSMYDIETGSFRKEFVHRSQLYRLDERNAICAQLRQDIKSTQQWLEQLEDEDFQIPQELGMIW